MKYCHTHQILLLYSAPGCAVFEVAAEAGLLSGSYVSEDGNPGSIIESGEEYSF